MVLGAAEEASHNLGVDGTPSARNAADRLKEFVDVNDTILEEVAHAFRTIMEELPESRHLDVLAEEQDTDGGIIAADPPRGAHAFIRLRRWHAHIEDDKVRTVICESRVERFGGANSCDDLNALAGEQAHQTFTEEHRIVGNHDAHGNSAVMVVPHPAGLARKRRPWWASTRSTSPRMPVPASMSAPPMPSSDIRTTNTESR